MKDVEDSEFEIPEPFAAVLRGYQKTGYRWLKSLDAYGFGGILADEMGLGKTIQIIALLLDEKRQGGGRTLIVCPASLVYNWENEIVRFAPELSVAAAAVRFAPELSVAAAAGSQGEREQLFERLSAEKDGGTDVVITSYDLLKRDLAFYRSMDFRYQIIDEAQYIKNAATQASRAVKSISARARFALTGTPMENHLGELWSIFDFLMPGFLFTYQKFKKTFETPIVRDGSREALERLHRMIGPFLLRRLKKDVLKELPSKMETVLYSRMEGEQKRIYTASAAALKERLLAGELETGEDRMQILAELLRLRQICCDPSLCFPRYKGGSAKLETCMELLENGTRAGHRMQILAELLRLRQICCDPSLCFPRYKGGSAKLETCMELLENGTRAGHKILLFSQFTSMLDVIAGRLSKEKIRFYMLTGATPKGRRMQMVSDFHKKILLFSQFTSMLDVIAGRLSKEKIRFYMLTGATPKGRRMQMVSDFHKDDVMVFLISLKAGGTGLNLTAADVVIHYDPWWNAAAQDQATDRAHRMGQENQVTVFRLVTSHTVEENILKLQERKRDLADSVVTEGTGSFAGLTREDLLAMLDT